MRRTTTTGLALAAACLAFATAAFATPVPNSAVIHTRVFDDCPISILTVNNNFPAIIEIDDQNQPPDPLCSGFANLHTWRFSTDGVNDIQFLNEDTFEYSCEIVLTGIGEGGLNLAPWWGPQTDGLMNIRTTDGEIACFGGRMPFYSFTGAHGLVYTSGTPILAGISYIPNGLSGASPAQVIYSIRYNAINYTSGPLNFDQGNPAEDPPHGQWGALTPWYAGGHMKMFAFPPATPHGINGQWRQIQFTAGPTSGKKSTWSDLKKLYR
jgi:hypothetical protein